MLQGLKVDWFRVLADLSRAGVAASHVSLRIGVPASTVKDWGLGAEPRHADGERLLEIWRAVCQKTRDDTPMTPAVVIGRVVPRRK